MRCGNGLVYRLMGTRWLVGALMASLLVVGAGCDVSFDVGPGDLPGPGGGDVEPPAGVPDSGLLLTISNMTGAAVDAEIYVSTNALDVTADALFIEEHRFTDGIGLAAAGILQPETTDVVELVCSNGFVFGTAGGRFLDPETGEELGFGPPRILQEGLVFDCDAEIALIFMVDEDEYTVTVALQ